MLDGDRSSSLSSFQHYQSRNIRRLTIRLQMFNALRRGPTSIAQLTRLPSSIPRSIPRIQQSLRCYGNPNIVARAFSSKAPLRQHAAARVVEAEIEQTPSDNPTKEAIRHGPVTQFQELSDRSMVCDTLVKTITRNMGLETMTQVQSMTINETLKGIDV